MALRAFLDGVGANWIPIEMDPRTVIEREQRGQENAAVALPFLEAYFKQRAYELSPEGSEIVDLTADNFFRLGAVVDWAWKIRDRMRSQAAELDETLRNEVLTLREEYDRDRTSLDRSLPPIPFDPNTPTTFIWTHVLRLLVLEAKAYHLKKNDGLDFYHAVLGCAYGSIATLDKQWKRRIESLPKPNQAALLFYCPELDQLACALEGAVASMGTSRRSG
jgi:hypothetical protein